MNTLYMSCCRVNKVVSTALSVLVITINIYFVIQTVQEDLPHHWAIFFVMSLYAILYLLFCAYLAIHMAVSMGATSLGNHWVCIFFYLFILALNYLIKANLCFFFILVCCEIHRFAR